jgi:dTDP-4-amino-4,6-dideoxygalactose transaminase
MTRIYLSPPHAGELERRLLLAAFDSNWLAPIGPDLDAFEREFADYVGVPHAVALSSGTAALHLALLALGIGRGDRVITSTLTFAATANAIAYVGATPVFVDVSRDTWTMDPDLLDEELTASASSGHPVAAVLTVDLYGQCADYARIETICRRHGVPVVEDAAEALGAVYRGRSAGAFGACAAFSFNGNKIITTSGGGMLVSHNRDVVARARHLSKQARQRAPHYQHEEIGFNYGMSNLLAGVGRGQLQTLPEKLAKRRLVNEVYRAAFAHHRGLTFMPEAEYGRSNCWLTCMLVEPSVFGVSREQIRLHLESRDIESRPVWKPLHQQPVFRRCHVRGGAVAAELFERGLCLPSGSSLTEAEQRWVIAAVEECWQADAVVTKPASRPRYDLQA